MNALITHINFLGIDFPIARTSQPVTSVTQKNCFRIICVIISGLIVPEHSGATLFMCLVVL